MFELNDFGFGPASLDRTPESEDPGRAGAVAALETFYYALNNRDGVAMGSVWSSDELAQLNNPVGGVSRGGRAAVELYESIFASGLRLEVTFGDAVTYLFPQVAVFAGREIGTWSVGDGAARPLSIRTSRFFAYDVDAGRWVQVHHHGSIDDPQALGDYQAAVRGDRTG